MCNTTPPINPPSQLLAFFLSVLSAQLLELLWLTLRVGPLEAPIGGESGGGALPISGERSGGALPIGGEEGGGGGAGRGSLAGSGCVLDTSSKEGSLFTSVIFYS